MRDDDGSEISTLYVKLVETETQHEIFKYNGHLEMANDRIIHEIYIDACIICCYLVVISAFLSMF